MTRRETFTNLSEVWAKEVELYSTNEECLKVLVGNKVDRVSPIKLLIIGRQCSVILLLGKRCLIEYISCSYEKEMCRFQDSERAVTQEEGMALAQQLKCSFLECSARTRANVHQCFKDLVLKVIT